MSDQQEPNPQIDQPTQQQPDFSQKGPTKKLNSYTYWVDEKNKSRTLPPEQRPQKIEQPTLVKQKSDNGRSDWNTAGTWQHKNISLSDIEKKYSQRINQWALENCPDRNVKLVQLKGECEVIFTSKKKALTYEIHGKVEFQKQIQEEKKQQKSQLEKPKDETKDQQPSEQVKSPNSSSQDNSLEKKSDSKSPQSKPKSKPKSTEKKDKPKPQTMTFEIVDLTDHGDRQFKSKADNTEDMRFIGQKSESLLCLLEEILKSYK